MNIKTKFNHNQHVQSITQRAERTTVVCEICAGIGKVEIPIWGQHVCPNCRGEKGITTFGESIWCVPTESHYSFTIHKIVVESNSTDGTIIDKTQYMAAHSGSLFYEHNLFETTEEAQQECDRRNFVAKANLFLNFDIQTKDKKKT